MNIMFFTIAGITPANKHNISETLSKIEGAKALTESEKNGLYVLPVISLGSSQEQLIEVVTSSISGTGAYLYQTNADI